MLTIEDSVNRLRGWGRAFRSGSVRTTRVKTVSILFGDEFGTLLFLGSLVFFGFYWRIGIFVTDNWTIANTLVAVTDGHLDLVRVVYGPNAYAPGLNEIDGEFYGRNYGQVFLALPFYYIIELLSFVSDLRIAIAGIWSLILLGFVHRLGSVLETPRWFGLLGNGLALAAFGLNVSVAVPFEPRLRYLAALQLSTLFAAAMLGVVAYRLIAAIHDRRTGLFVGGMTLLASPVAFWASIPKRHILVSLLALLILYAFFLSRNADSGSSALRARCLAYGSVGVWAWVHAPEALAMLTVLIPVDMATARSNAPQRLAVVATSFVASLIPFFLTNWLIAGNPLKPPRFLSQLPPESPDKRSSDPTAGSPIDNASNTSGGGPVDGSSDSFAGTPADKLSSGESRPNGLEIEPIIEPLATQLGTGLRSLTTLGDLMVNGFQVLITQPANVFHTFVRSAPYSTRATATDLTVLESTPILAVLIAIPILLFVRNRWHPDKEVLWRETAVRQTDTFALVFVVTFTLLYLSRLPLHAMWTVRYLLPIVPFGLYFVGRLDPVRHTISRAGPTFGYTYTGLVLIGGQLLVVLLVELEPTRGEVVQFHGLIGLIAAGIAALWVVAAVLELLEDERIGAIAIATPLAVGTLFILLTGLEYFVNGRFALGLSQRLSQVIPLF